MKIKVKKSLLKENKLDSYSNIWKSWKTISDFDEWNRSQVFALAKHRKGQGKFNFKFYDKVYQDLKLFINKYDKEMSWEGGQYKQLPEPMEENIFYNLYYRDHNGLNYGDKNGIISNLLRKHRIGSHNSGRSIPELEVAQKYVDAFEKEYDDIAGGTWTSVRPKVISFKSRSPWGGENFLPVYTFSINVEPLKQDLKNMEKLMKSFPWDKRNLPNIQKQLGIYEIKIKNR